MTKVLDLRPKLRTREEVSEECINSMAESVKAMKEKMTRPVGYFTMWLDHKGDYCMSYDLHVTEEFIDGDETPLDFVADIILMEIEKESEQGI